MKLTRPEFEKLALEHLDMLYRVGCRLTHNAEDAADLVQETFLRALKAHDTFDLQQHGIRPWLVRIMQNLHFSRADREKRQPMSMDAAALDASTEGEPAHSAGTGTFNWDAMDERLVRALTQVPAEYRVVLLLWAVEEFSYKEISDALEIPIGTVMSRLHRARQRLMTLLHAFAVSERLIRE